jgi:hypothetical protein
VTTANQLIAAMLIAVDKLTTAQSEASAEKQCASLQCACDRHRWCNRQGAQRHALSSDVGTFEHREAAAAAADCAVKAPKEHCMKEA